MQNWNKQFLRIFKVDSQIMATFSPVSPRLMKPFSRKDYCFENFSLYSVSFGKFLRLVYRLGILTCVLFGASNAILGHFGPYNAFLAGNNYKTLQSMKWSETLPDTFGMFRKASEANNSYLPVMGQASRFFFFCIGGNLVFYPEGSFFRIDLWCRLCVCA